MMSKEIMQSIKLAGVVRDLRGCFRWAGLGQGMEGQGQNRFSGYMRT